MKSRQFRSIRRSSATGPSIAIRIPIPVSASGGNGDIAWADRADVRTLHEQMFDPGGIPGYR